MADVREQREFELVELSEGRLVVRATGPCSAQALAVAAGMSRASAARTFAAGLVARAGDADGAGPLSGGTRLAPGDVLAFALQPTGPVAVPASAPPTPAGVVSDGIAVLYEDPVLLVVDKPAGLLVHGDGSGVPTLTDLVRGHLMREGLAGPARAAQAVQRLDVDTTGAVVFSKTEQLQPALDSLVAEHDASDAAGDGFARGAGVGMRKRYLAVVRGDFPSGVRTCELGVARDRHDARRMRAVPMRPGAPRGAKAARTTLALLDRRDGFSLVMAELGTGRRHQIRVHLASLGFPIVGDPLYGPPPCGQGRGQGRGQVCARRCGGAARGADVGADACGLMLHAWETSFAHPVTGERVVVRAPLPRAFAEAGFSEPVDADAAPA